MSKEYIKTNKKCPICGSDLLQEYDMFKPIVWDANDEIYLCSDNSEHEFKIIPHPTNMLEYVMCETKKDGCMWDMCNIGKNGLIILENK